MTTWPGTSIPKSTGNAFDWRAGMRPSVETRVCTKCGEEKPITHSTAAASAVPVGIKSS